MRTTLNIDDDLLTALLSRHPESTKTEAIERAIRSYLETSAVEGLRRIAGHMEIEDVSQELRRVDRSSLSSFPTHQCG